jgi:N-acetylmuramoyl-L-alanine amidase
VFDGEDAREADALTLGAGSAPVGSGAPIVIDPGHGGKDPGAVANGLQEKEIVLDVSLQLARLLRASGRRVILTRDGDDYPSLADRTRIAKDNGAALLLSVHANAVNRSSVRGIETFYPRSGAHQTTSRNLAQHLQTQMLRAVSNTDRGIKRDQRGLYLLRTAAYPVALVELGFITNGTDAAYLRDAGTRAKLARALHDGVIAFLGD